MAKTHTREISRENKCLLLFLLDQSGSMAENMGNTQKKLMDELATAINSLLQNMVIRAQGSEGVRDYMDVGVFGYCTDDQANAIVETSLNSALQAKQNESGLVSIVDLADNAEMESRMQEIFDEDTGEIISTPVNFPVWVKPKAQYGTPMCYALDRATTVLDAWIAQHPSSFPPIVVNITDGETTDGGDPVQYAGAVKDRSTQDGNVLLFNCHLSAVQADPFLFPNNSELLPDRFARILFDMSSEFPETMFDRANAEGFDLKPGARGMAFNADLVSLIKFLDIGTRVTNLK